MAAPPLNLSYGIAAGFDDNVNTGEKNDQQRTENWRELTLFFNMPVQLGHNSLLIFNSELAYVDSKHFDKLSRLNSMVEMRYHFIFSNAFNRNLYQLFLTYRGSDAKSDRRDLYSYTLGFHVQRKLTLKTSVVFGGDIRSKEARGKVFDVQDMGVFSSFDFLINNQSTIYVGFRHMKGDVTSTGRPSFGLLQLADAVEPDDAFGGVDTEQFLYRLSGGKTYILTTGYNYAFNPQTSIDVSLRYVTVTAVGGNAYQRNLLNLQFIRQF